VGLAQWSVVAGLVAGCGGGAAPDPQPPVGVVGGWIATDVLAALPSSPVQGFSLPNRLGPWGLLVRPDLTGVWEEQRELSEMVPIFPDSHDVLLTEGPDGWRVTPAEGGAPLATCRRAERLLTCTHPGGTLELRLLDDVAAVWAE
jgi:hypothetical protein